jgi:hypothetical protein
LRKRFLDKKLNAASCFQGENTYTNECILKFIRLYQLVHVLEKYQLIILFLKGICCNSDINNDVGEINKSMAFGKAGCLKTKYF